MSAARDALRGRGMPRHEALDEATRDGTGLVTTALAVVFALVAAASFATAAVLQQEAAQATPSGDSLRLRLLGDLLRRPRWLAGVAMLVVGYGFQALALGFGPVALVQPVVVTELAFAIPIATWRMRKRSSRREWTGIAMVLAGIGTFLAVADPAAGRATATIGDWVSSLVPVAGLAAVAVIVASRATGRRRAMLLGAAAGLAFALLAVLTKSVVHVISRDGGGVFGDWQLYGVVAIGVVALLVSQSAYQAGPLAFSMPFIGVLEPAVAVIIGDTVLDENVALSPGLVALEAVAAAIAAAGIVTLTTSPLVVSIYEEGAAQRERARRRTSGQSSRSIT